MVGIFFFKKNCKARPIYLFIYYSCYSSSWGHLQAADVVLACCAADHGAVRTHSPGFTAGGPGFHECQCDGRRGQGKPGNGPKCSLPPNNWNDRISFHHVDPAKILQLSKSEKERLSISYERYPSFSPNIVSLD